MDKLYYYVRQVDRSLRASINSLNDLDDLYEEIDVERQTVNNFIDEINDYDSNYDVESEDETEEQDEDNLGDTIMELWKKRKTKLVHDLQ